MCPEHQLTLPVCLRPLQSSNLRLLPCLHETFPRDAVTFAVPVAVLNFALRRLARMLIFEPDQLLSLPPSLYERPHQLKLESGANASGCVMDRHSVHQRLDRVDQIGAPDLQPCWITVRILGASHENFSLTSARITWGIEMTCMLLGHCLPRFSQFRA